MDHKRDPDQISLPRERRLNMRLMAFWWDRRANRRFPSAEDFDPDELSDVWRHCFTLSPRKPSRRSAFQYVGDTIATESGITGGKITIAKVSKNSLLDHATRNVDEVLTQRVPVIHSGEYVNEAGATVVFRSILLPLSRDQKTIDCVVGGARCKVLRPA